VHVQDVKGLDARLQAYLTTCVHSIAALLRIAEGAAAHLVTRRWIRGAVPGPGRIMGADCRWAQHYPRHVHRCANRQRENPGVRSPRRPRAGMVSCCIDEAPWQLPAGPGSPLAVVPRLLVRAAQALCTCPQHAAPAAPTLSSTNFAAARIQPLVTYAAQSGGGGPNIASCGTGAAGSTTDSRWHASQQFPCLTAHTLLLHSATQP
jgi:hypothetical protein